MRWVVAKVSKLRCCIDWKILQYSLGQWRAVHEDCGKIKGEKEVRSKSLSWNKQSQVWDTKKVTLGILIWYKESTHWRVQDIVSLKTPWETLPENKGLTWLNDYWRSKELFLQIQTVNKTYWMTLWFNKSISNIAWHLCQEFFFSFCMSFISCSLIYLTWPGCNGLGKSYISHFYCLSSMIN